jgi:hypothetical protein
MLQIIQKDYDIASCTSPERKYPGTAFVYGHSYRPMRGDVVPPSHLLSNANHIPVKVQLCATFFPTQIHVMLGRVAWGGPHNN